MKKRRQKSKIIFVLNIVFLLIFSSYIETSAVELKDIKIEYKGDVFTADTSQVDLENRFFFNELSETNLNLSIDLSTYYKERQPSNEEAPFEIITTLNDAKTPIGATITPNVSTGDFIGKYDIEITVPAGNDKDFVNVLLQSKTGTDWNIINPFSSTFNILRDSSAPNIIIDGIDEFGVAKGEVAISLYEDYKQSSKMNVSIVGPNNIPLSVNGEYKGTSIVRVNESADGQYKGVVTATDKAGNSSKKEISFIINHSAPTVKFDGGDTVKEYYKNNFIRVEIYDLFGIDLAKSSYKLTSATGKETVGKFDATETNQGLAVVNFEEEGKYLLEINAIDSLGQSTTSKSTFIADKTLPTVDISNLENLNNSIRQQIDNVEIKVTEDNFDVDKVKVIIQKNINNEVQNIEINGKDIPNKSNGNVHIFTLSSIFEEDRASGALDIIYDITAIATDRAGNEMNPKSNNKVKFTVDNNAPKLSIVGAENNKFYNADKIEIKGIVEDINIENSDFVVKRTVKKIGSKPETIVIDKNNISVSTEGNVTTYIINLSDEGIYDVTLNAKDKAGNTQKSALSFNIDRTKPIVTINNYEDIDGTFSASAKKVSISVSDLNWKQTSVNVVLVKQKPDGTSDTINLPFAMNKEITTVNYDEFTDDATYTVNVSASDSAGNAAEVKAVTFTTDKTAPIITLTGVENNDFYNSDRPVIVKVRDLNHSKNTIVVLKDNKPYPVSGFYGDGIDKVFNYTFSKEGIYQIDVTSVDMAGNQANLPTVIFTIDKTSPGIKAYFKGENRAIIDGEYINKIFTPEFRLDNSEDVIQSITLNGEGNYAQGAPMASKEMEYKYNVVARDKANNETAYTISFTVDTTVPDIKLNGLLSGFFNKDLKPSFEITDTHLVADKSGATLNGEPYESGTPIVEQKEYTLQIKGVDLANNETIKSIGFTLDKDKPVIRFVEPISGKYFTEDFIPKFVIDDLSNYTIIAMTLDGKDYQMGEMITEEGKHVLYIEVKDKAGNVESISVEFILDKTPPKFIISGVENGGKYQESVSATIKLENPLDTITSIEVDGQLANGDIKTEGDQQIAKLKFSDLKKYKVKISAKDEAGNQTEDILEFEIFDNNVISQITTNKSILVPIVVASLTAIGVLVYSIYRSKNKDTKE